MRRLSALLADQRGILTARRLADLLGATDRTVTERYVKRRGGTWTTAGAGERPVVWGSGGGTPSAAIVVLVLRSELPRPERIVMADTGREASATPEEVVGPALAGAGLEVEVAPHRLATKGLYDGRGRPLGPPCLEGPGPIASDVWRPRRYRRNPTLTSPTLRR